MKKTFFYLICLFLSHDFFAQGTWTQLTSFPSAARWGSSSFDIGNKGYVGMGYDGTNHYGDLWEYDPGANSWTQKAGITVGRRLCATFAVNGKGYVSLGATTLSSPTIQEVWEFNPSNNSWVQKNNFPSSPRYSPATFVIGNKAYIVCGNEGSSSGPFTNELWEYNPTNDTWIQKTNFPSTARYGCTGFELNNFGYVGLGYSGSFHNDLYMYDATNDSWIQKANFAGTARNYAIGFKACNKSYVGLGQSNGNAYSDIWEYNYFGNTWSQATNFGGGNRWVSVSCVINGTAYAGLGSNNGFTNMYNDWWKFSCDGNGIFENELINNFVSIHPTVFSNSATLEIISPYQNNNCELKIFDITGKLNREEKIISYKMNIERKNLQQGVYFFEVINENKKIGWGKFIVE
ncbi:MAG: T9SS type A sorting domain-containing protein [Bacteroidetes bacterium]|nr:T9SS type A sorting domain-containing protein [Bacteroidota bacterium]